ncbi:beta transducin [Hypoxylon texense]
MCTHSKTIYRCNHSHTSPYPCKPCRRQHDFEAGRRPLPCDEVWTHGRNSFRVPGDCQRCQEKQAKLGRRFDYAKMRLADLRKQLEAAYDGCGRHLEDAGLSRSVSSSSSTTTTTPAGSRPGSPALATRSARSASSASALSSTSNTMVTVESRRKYGREQRKRSVASSAGEDEKVDPVQEFLRKKRLESDAHLMMLSAI